MSATNLYFCVFCDDKWTVGGQSSGKLRDHIVNKHFDRRVDEKTDAWIAKLAAYQLALNRSLRQTPSRLPIVSSTAATDDTSPELLVGCRLCDRIIECFKLDLIDGHKQKRKCVCGSGVEANKVVVTCHLCSQISHYDCVEPMPFSGEDLSLYRCLKCKHKTALYTISGLKSLSKTQQSVHLHQHLDYLPYACRAVKGGQQVCNESFPSIKYLKAHIKADHNLALTEEQLREQYITHRLIPKVQQLIDRSADGEPARVSPPAANTHQTVAAARGGGGQGGRRTTSGSPNTNSSPSKSQPSPPVLSPIRPLPSDMNDTPNRAIGFARRTAPSAENGNSANDAGAAGPPLRSPPLLVNANTHHPSDTVRTPPKRRRGPGRPRKSPTKSRTTQSLGPSNGHQLMADSNVIQRATITPNGYIADRNPLLKSRLSDKSRLSRPNISLSREEEQALRTNKPTANGGADGSDESTGWNSDVEEFERNTHTKRVKSSPAAAAPRAAGSSASTSTVITHSNGSIPVINGRPSQAVNNSRPESVGRRVSQQSSSSHEENSLLTIHMACNTPDREAKLAANRKRSQNSPNSVQRREPTAAAAVGGRASHSPDVENVGSVANNSEPQNTAAMAGPSVSTASNSDWLLHTRPKKFPYYPQKDDEVAYIPYGHRLYSDHVRALNLYKQTNHNKYMKGKDYMFAKVREIRYERHANVRLVRLTLVALRDSAETNTVFTIKYTDIDNVIDFLILKQLFVKSIDVQWTVGQTFRSIVDDKWWFGTIREQHITEHNMNNYFQGIQIQWANNTVDNLSYWDLDKVVAPLPVNRRSSVEVTDDDRQEFYVSDSAEWPRRGKRDECSRISKALTQIMDLHEWRELSMTFDHLKDRYMDDAPYPIDLYVIKARVDNLFYRRQSAVKYDIKFIESNASYLTRNDENSDNSELVINARIVTACCLRFIDDKTATDITDIHAKVIADLSHLNKIKYYSCTRQHLNPSLALNPELENERRLNQMLYNDVEPSAAATTTATAAASRPPNQSTINGNDGNEITVVDMTLTSDEESGGAESDADDAMGDEFALNVKPEPADEESDQAIDDPFRQQVNKYFCILCEQTFGDRNEMVDHYCRELNVELKCSHCPQNQTFDSLDAFMSHNPSHTPAKCYLQQKSWIDRMVKYCDGLTSEVKVQRQVHRLYGDWCPVCKCLNVLTRDATPLFNDRVFANNRRSGSMKPMAAERDFHQHLNEHMQYELVYSCSLCDRTGGQSVFRSQVLAACRQHVIDGHNMAANADESRVMSCYQNTKIPVLEKKITHLVNKFMVKCLYA